jgi:hypothetical protein
MKLALFISTAFFSTLAMANPNPLVSMTVSSGAPDYTTTVVVSDDGSVQETIGSGFSAGGSSTLNLATLSPTAVSRLQYWIGVVQVDQPSVDPNPNGPSCASEGGSSVSLLHPGSEFVISSSGGCHTRSVPGSYGVVEIMKGLMELAK